MSKKEANLIIIFATLESATNQKFSRTEHSNAKEVIQFKGALVDECLYVGAQESSLRKHTLFKEGFFTTTDT